MEDIIEEKDLEEPLVLVETTVRMTHTLLS